MADFSPKSMKWQKLFHDQGFSGGKRRKLIRGLILTLARQNNSHNSARRRRHERHCPHRLPPERQSVGPQRVESDPERAVPGGFGMWYGKGPSALKQVRINTQQADAVLACDLVEKRPGAAQDHAIGPLGAGAGCALARAGPEGRADAAMGRVCGAGPVTENAQA
ncbi:hypothetical protein [Amphibiibacter pelophylacis]|uniref:Uncharacterized protein n=1 Tax=Amphibiibacter pelophylacis TaxID=1799477 RepID=A0ACC6NYV0_9BURK